MKTLVKLVLVIVFTSSIFSCQESDNVSAPPARPYAEVYPEDTLKIREFMETHYITVDADYNTTFTQIPAGGTQTPIANMTELDTILRKFHDITYKIYYLKLREGTGESPTRVDSSFVAYKGNTFTKTTTNNVDTYTQNVFDQSDSPVWFALEDVIKGWGEVIPKFKTGIHTVNTDGTVSFQNYGAGVMFLPSGLGYYNSATGNIGSYSPLIFSFKLYNQRYRDHDRDKILSKFEYREKETSGLIDFNKVALDTDGDGLPNYLDVDDDADGVLTKVEIAFTYMDAGIEKTKYYPYDGAAVDDPATPYDERKGIPRKFTGPIISPSTLPSPQDSDFTASDRLRRHLDKTCKPPYTN
jgi:FKBP-type peptidyl-prolyl cis-trans isomerase FkpA